VSFANTDVISRRGRDHTTAWSCSTRDLLGCRLLVMCTYKGSFCTCWIELLVSGTAGSYTPMSSNRSELSATCKHPPHFPSICTSMISRRFQEVRLRLEIPSSRYAGRSHNGRRVRHVSPYQAWSKVLRRNDMHRATATSVRRGRDEYEAVDIHGMFRALVGRHWLNRRRRTETTGH
jgi:hypothetical protein